MTCREIETKCQAVDARRPVTFDWTDACANKYIAGEVRALNEVIRPSVPNGFQYRYTRAGQAGAKEPKFAKTGEVVGAPYDDGYAQLTAELISNASLARTVATSTWEGPDGIEIDGDGQQTANGEQKTWAYVEGATKGTYRVRNPVVFSDGEIDVGEVDIEIE